MTKGWDKDKARHSAARRFGKAPPYRNKPYIKVIKGKKGYRLAKETKPTWQKGLDLTKGYLTEREILLIKRRLNGKKMTLTQFWDTIGYEGIKITPAQTQKGLDWLNDQWKTPRGAERKNNPFGTREQDTLKTFQRFELADFHDASSAYNDFKYYLPVYRVIGKKGAFEYYVSGGNIHITG